MEIKITLETEVAYLAKGAKVGTAAADGGTSPYTYSLVTGADYFNIDSTSGVITVKEEMIIDNIQKFSVKATDGASASVTSEEVYPHIQPSWQEKFNKVLTYRITQDIVDFQGGTIGGGAIVFDRTLLLPLGLDISKYISATITGTYREGQILYDSSLKKMKLWNGSTWVNLDGTALE